MTNFVHVIHHQFVHFVDRQKPERGLMNNFIRFIHPYTNSLPIPQLKQLSKMKNTCEYCDLHKMATDSCRDGWNVRNCSLSHIKSFQDRWNVQIGDGWNIQKWLSTNLLKLVQIWLWILQNLHCLNYKSTTFVLVVKPTLMSLFWLFGLFVC